MIRWASRAVLRAGRFASKQAVAMWCKRCQQDVPGIADGEAALVCARCRTPLRPAHSPTDDVSPASSATPTPPASSLGPLAAGPLAIDDWQVDGTLHEAQRLLDRVAPQLAAAAKMTAVPVVQERSTNETAAVSKGAVALEPDQPRGGALAWTFLFLGTTAVVCGGMLAAWSLAASKAHLWDLGLPILIAGQAGLLVGIVLQLARVWHNGRLASQRLVQVDRQLDDLEHTTSLLGNTYGAGSSVFYSHLAQGASPHLLLADLKSQVDLLAMKVSRAG